MVLSTCETISGEAYTSIYQSLTEYEWYMPDASDWEIEEEYHGGAIENRYVEIDYWESPAPSYETVAIRAQNSCGWSAWKMTSWTVDDCGGYYYSMMMYPNPVDDQLTLTVTSKDEMEDNNAPIAEKNNRAKRYQKELPVYEILMYHKDKGLMKRISSQDKQLQINTADLKTGLYFVLLIIEGKTYKKSLVIKR